MVPRRANVVSGLIIAAALTAQGLYLLARPGAYRSPVFEQTTFEFAPPVVWGWAFLFSAAIYAAFRRPPYGIGMAAVMAAWSANIGAATIQGISSSPAGWVWSATIAVLLLVAQARGGR